MIDDSRQTSFLNELRQIYRHRWWLIAPCVILVGGALTYNAMARPVFVSRATVSVEALSRMPGLRATVDQATSEAAIGKEVTRLASLTLIEEAIAAASNDVVRQELATGKIRTGFDVLPGFLAGLFGNPPSQAPGVDAILAFQSRLSVTRPSGTTWIQLSFSSYDPEAGALALNAFLDAYLAESQRAVHEASEVDQQLLDRELTRQKSVISETLGALKATSARTEGGNPAYRRPMVQRELGALQEQYASVSGRIVTLAAGLSVAPDGTRSLPQTPRVLSLLARLDDVKTKLASRTELGERHPEVQSLSSQLEFLESELKSEATSERARQEDELKTLQRQQHALGEALERGINRASGVAESSFEAATLMREADAGERAITEMIERRTRGGDIPVFEARVVQRAARAFVPEFPRKSTNILMAAAAALLSGLMLARFRHQADGTLRTIEEVKALGTDLPLLGVVPKDPEIETGGLDAVLEEPTALAEGYRVVRTNVASKARVIAVTSARPGDGKSTTSAALAHMLAENGDRVLLIEGDLRRPSLDRLFPGCTSRGVVEALNSGLDGHLVVLPKFDFLPAGESSATTAARLGDGRFAALIAVARERYRFVVIDTPPALALADASIIGTLADGVVIVIAAGKTAAGALLATLDQLRNQGVTILGLVLNQVDFRDLSDAYGAYYSAYSRYYTKRARPRAKKAQGESSLATEKR